MLGKERCVRILEGLLKGYKMGKINVLQINAVVPDFGSGDIESDVQIPIIDSLFLVKRRRGLVSKNSICRKVLLDNGSISPAFISRACLEELKEESQVSFLNLGLKNTVSLLCAEDFIDFAETSIKGENRNLSPVGLDVELAGQGEKGILAFLREARGEYMETFVLSECVPGGAASALWLLGYLVPRSAEDLMRVFGDNGLVKEKLEEMREKCKDGIEWMSYCDLFQVSSILAFYHLLRELYGTGTEMYAPVILSGFRFVAVLAGVRRLIEDRVEDEAKKNVMIRLLHSSFKLVMTTQAYSYLVHTDGFNDVMDYIGDVEVDHPDVYFDGIPRLDLYEQGLVLDGCGAGSLLYCLRRNRDNWTGEDVTEYLGRFMGLVFS